MAVPITWQTISKPLLTTLQQCLEGRELARSLQISAAMEEENLFKAVAAAFIKVKPKNVRKRHLVPLVFTVAQERYDRERTLRDIILKPRRLGFSTLIVARYYLKTITVPYTTTVIVSYTGEHAVRLLRIARLAHENLPEEFRPRVKYDSALQMSFPELGSVIQVGKAGQKHLGHGETISYLLCSEASRYPNPSDLMEGLLEAVSSPEDGGEIVIETTANEYGDWFHDFYTEAKHGRNGFKAHFWRWFDELTYRVKLKAA